jgi:hypothetical protein
MLERLERDLDATMFPATETYPRIPGS